MSFVPVDGDTVGVTYQENFRIAGIDAPEIRSACASERELGLKAQSRLRQLLGSGKVVVAPIMTPKARYDLDKYGRPLAVILVDGKSVGEILVAEGLAVRYDGSGPRPSWCR